MGRSFTIAMKHLFLVTYDKWLFDQEVGHSNFTYTSWNTFQHVEFLDFLWVHVEPIYRVSSLSQFSWDGPIFCCNADTHILKHFFDTLCRFCSTCVFKSWTAFKDEHFLPPWYWRLLSPLRIYKNQKHSVRSYVGYPSHSLLILAAFWKALWQRFNSLKNVNARTSDTRIYPTHHIRLNSRPMTTVFPNIFFNYIFSQKSFCHEEDAEIALKPLKFYRKDMTNIVTRWK